MALIYNAPQASGLRRESVHKLAEGIAKQLGYNPGDDLIPIVARLGGKISFQDAWEMDTATSGSVRIDREGKFEIFLALHTGQSRDRFTIAHEIGHYILHYLWPKKHGHDVGPIEATRYGAGRVEYEANWFAAAFLMPADSFKQSFESANGDLSEVSSKFGVSMAAAKIRAQSLGLIH